MVWDSNKHITARSLCNHSPNTANLKARMCQPKMYSETTVLFVEVTMATTMCTVCSMEQLRVHVWLRIKKVHQVWVGMSSNALNADTPEGTVAFQYGRV